MPYTDSKFEKGQALLFLVIIMAIASVILFSGFTLVTINLANTNREDLGKIALLYAESGVEEGIIRTLRNQNFTGYTFTIDEASVNVVVSGTDPYTVTSTATVNSIKKKSQAIWTKSGTKRKNNAWNISISSWNEIP